MSRSSRVKKREARKDNRPSSHDGLVDHVGRIEERLEGASISETARGPEHPEVAITLNNLAELYRALRRYSEAESLYKRSPSIFEKALGADHPNAATVLENYAFLLRKVGGTLRPKRPRRAPGYCDRRQRGDPVERRRSAKTGRLTESRRVQTAFGIGRADSK